MILGVPTVDPSNADFIPLSVMDALLGGAFASRITKNIREDKGYTYSPEQRPLGPLSRRLLVGERRRHDHGDRAVDQGDPRGDRSAAGRAASRRRS